MPVKSFRPLTPSTRYITVASYADITKSTPEKSLVFTRKKTGGRNAYGRVTSRGIGGGNKQKIRNVDFKRTKHGVEATVTAIEYDPRRTARLALLQYADGVKAYMLAPVGIQVGTKLTSGPTAPPEVAFLRVRSNNCQGVSVRPAALMESVVTLKSISPRRFWPHAPEDAASSVRFVPNVSGAFGVLPASPRNSRTITARDPPLRKKSRTA